MQTHIEREMASRQPESVVMKQPFVKPFPFKEGWTDETFKELMAEWNIYAPHEVPAQRADPAEAAVVALQRELIRNVGDDVCTGIVSVATTFDTLTASPLEMQLVPPPPSLDLATSPATPVGAALTIGGRKIALPLVPDDVEYLSSIALAAKEARGTSFEAAKPQGTERACCSDRKASEGRLEFPTRYLTEVDTSIPLCGPDSAGQVEGALATFPYPTALDAIHRALCPDADSLELRPWRLDVYRQGDGLRCNELPEPEPDQVGCVIVNLPLVSDYELGLSRMAHKEMDTCFDPDRTVGTYESGEHRFYVGRDLALDNPEMPVDVMHNMKDTGFDRPCAGAVLETRFAPAEYTAIEVTNASGVRPLKFAAFSHDVTFESLPTLLPTMVTLRYKVFRKGTRTVWNIPRREAILHLVHSAFHFMVLRPNPVTLLPSFPSDPSFLRPVNIGIFLRHVYDPATVLKNIDTPENVLKRLDAITHRVISSAYETRVVPAVLYKSDCHCAAWRVQEFPHRFVFASLKGFSELREEAGYPLSAKDCMPALVSALKETITNSLWAQIGNGRLLGGGGNAYEECVCDALMDAPDCTTDWWYQGAVLVVMPEPARWARRKPLFSIKLRSRDRTEAQEDSPKSLAGALHHWNVFENILTFL